MKNIVLTFCSTILLAFIFSGCSWQEYFVISNETNSEVTVEYKIEDPATGFAIFETKPSVYTLNSSADIDWNKELSVIDKDTALLSIHITLPAKSTLVFGHLSNDNYETYNQNFINARVFNLTNLHVNNNETIIAITPDNFDRFFKKKNGNIIYRIK
jgi:hypothetical protein